MSTSDPSSIVGLERAVVPLHEWVPQEKGRIRDGEGRHANNSVSCRKSIIMTNEEGVNVGRVGQAILFSREIKDLVTNWE